MHLQKNVQMYSLKLETEVGQSRHHSVWLLCGILYTELCRHRDLNWLCKDTFSLHVMDETVYVCIN